MTKFRNRSSHNSYLSKFIKDGKWLPGVGSFIKDDITTYYQRVRSTRDILSFASKDSRRDISDIFVEFVELNKLAGSIQFDEYVKLGLHKDNPFEFKRDFCSDSIHWQVVERLNDSELESVTEDKWLTERLISDEGVRIPRIRAIIDKGDTEYGSTVKLSTPADVRDFLTKDADFPIFVKENQGIGGFGAFIINGADYSNVIIQGYDPIEYDEFMSQYIGNTVYCLQDLENNHEFFDDVSNGLATVRIHILQDHEDRYILFPVLKIPGNGNTTSHGWKAGNILCGISADGVIATAKRDAAFLAVDILDDPASGLRLLGKQLPMWRETHELVERVSTLFGDLKYISLDIGLLSDGPILIEVNSGGGFLSVQWTNGIGFLQEEVRRFFALYGCPGF